MSDIVRKGDWVRAQWFVAYTTCLAGFQVKTGATLQDVEGVVTQIRSDDPVQPINVMLTVKQANGVEVEVKPKWVILHRPKSVEDPLDVKTSL